MKILAIIQAGKDSLRFKNKVLSRLCEFVTLEHVIIRTLRCKLVDVTVIATTERKEDDEIAQIGNKWGIKVFRGSEESLTHFFEVARIYRPEHIIRIKADCSALDSKVVNIAITSHLFKNVYHITNTLQRTYPLGYDVEIFSYKALEWFYLDSLHLVKREHISLKFEKFCPFPVNNLKCREKFSGLRLTIDYKKDYEVMKILFENLYFEKIFLV